MTGRPSGRCAATEALERIVALQSGEIAPGRTHCPCGHILSMCHRVNAAKWCGGAGYQAVWIAQEALAALASPCCVSADQEQVKEALERIQNFPFDVMSTPEQDVGAMKEIARAALALLGSHEQEER